MALTHSDLVQVKDVIRKVLREKTRNILSKGEFLGWMYKLMAELKVIRESQEMLTEKVYGDHEERISAVEGKIGLAT